MRLLIVGPPVHPELHRLVVLLEQARHVVVQVATARAALAVNRQTWDACLVLVDPADLPAMTFATLWHREHSCPVACLGCGGSELARDPEDVGETIHLPRWTVAGALAWISAVSVPAPSRVLRSSL